MKTLLQANAQQIPLASGVVQMAATSPPYWGLRKYEGDQGVNWPAVTYIPMAGLPAITIEPMQCELGLEPNPPAYVGHLVTVFREVRRVLAADGVLWLNLGDTYTQDTKWGGKSDHKNYTSLQGGYQDVRNNRTDSGLPDKNLTGIPWRVALALQADGWWLRSDVIWNKPNAMPENVKDRPTKSHEHVFLLAKSSKYYYDAEAIKVKAINGDPNPPRGSQAASQSSTGVNSGRRIKSTKKKPPVKYRNRRSIWNVSTVSCPGAHFAAWPPALVELMIKAGSRLGDLVLDPFNGSGTTGSVAANLGRRYIGLDIGYTYLREIAQPRLIPKFGEVIRRGDSKPVNELPMFTGLPIF